MKTTKTTKPTPADDLRCRCWFPDWEVVRRMHQFECEMESFITYADRRSGDPSRTVMPQIIPWGGRYYEDKVCLKCGGVKLSLTKQMESLAAKRRELAARTKRAASLVAIGECPYCDTYPEDIEVSITGGLDACIHDK